MRKRQLLVIIPESPFPARKNGLSLRYYPLLTRLSRIFAIDLAVVTTSGDESVDLGDLEHRLHRVILIRRPSARPNFVTRVLAHVPRLLPFGMPFCYGDYGASAVAAQLKRVLAEPYDTVLWVTQDQVFAKCLPHLKGKRLILDQIDSNSLYLSRRFAAPRLHQRLSIEKMRRWEARMMSAADVGFYISPVDKHAVTRLVSHVALQVLPNGVLIDDYCTEKAPLQTPSLGFLGNMSYLPNIEAAHRVCRLHKRLRTVVPGLKLYIVGRDPDPSFGKYADDPDVVVTGTVDNIWPYVNAIDLFVLPMTSGAGQQNKLLEVMYAGRPIVASTIANGGVGAVDGASIVIADDEETLERKALELLNSPDLRATIASGGARFVRNTYSWDEIAARMAAAIDPQIDSVVVNQLKTSQR